MAGLTGALKAGVGTLLGSVGIDVHVNASGPSSPAGGTVNVEVPAPAVETPTLPAVPTMVVPRPELPSLDDIKLKLAGEGVASTVSLEQRPPGEVYPPVPAGLGQLGATFETFRLRVDGQALGEQALQQALQLVRSFFGEVQKKFLGFQVNQALSFSKDLSPFLDVHLNNIGDPFTQGSFQLNTKFLEQAVLDYHASLWNARWPHDSSDPDSYWGAVVNGSGEGNLLALWNARDYLTLPAAAVVRGLGDDTPGDTGRQAPVVLYPASKHYSIPKAAAILGLGGQNVSQVGASQFPGECPLPGSGGRWPDAVPVDAYGRVDLDALETLVEFFAARGYPILLVFNHGTSFQGAYDDLDAARARLVPILKAYGLYDEREVEYPDPADPSRTVIDRRRGYWVHVDGALGATHTPFLEMAYERGLPGVATRPPAFDFRDDFVSSVVASAHKWVGAPVPSGVYLTWTKFQVKPPGVPEYVGADTVGSSRSGFSSLQLWQSLAGQSQADQILKSVTAQAVADYLESGLRQLEEVLQGVVDLWVSRAPLSLAVLFRVPNDQLVDKYSLPTHTDAQGRQVTRVYAMEHVTFDLVDQLLQDLSQEGAFDPTARRLAGNQW